MNIALNFAFAILFGLAFLPAPEACHMNHKEAWGVLLYVCDGSCDQYSDGCDWNTVTGPSGYPESSCECDDPWPNRLCRAWIVNPSSGDLFRTADSSYCTTDNCAATCTKQAATSSFSVICNCPTP